MHQKFLTFGLLTALALVIGGCFQAGPKPKEPKIPLQSQPIEKRDGDTIDDLFTKVAQQVPAFGGMFLDAQDNNILYVYLLDPAQKEAAEKAIVEVFGPIHPDIIPPREMRVLQAQYSFLQLKQWKDLGGLLLGRLGVAMISIDDMRNRLLIGLEKMETVEQVWEELAELNIPREAVVFEETGPVRESGPLPAQPKK